jgi:hypothetical protein
MHLKKRRVVEIENLIIFLKLRLILLLIAFQAHPLPL